MAIQNRRGNYADFDPQKMVAGEWAVVQSGDPNSTRGKAVYMAFNVGDIERMATYEDMQENIVSATSDVQAQFASELTQTINDANSAVDDMQTSIDNEIQSASNTVATLTTNTNTAINSANTAAATANAAANRANDAVEAIQAIIDSDSVVLSWNGRTGQVTSQVGDYTSAQITHGAGTVSSALTFDSAPTAGSQRAVQSGGVYSVLGNETMGTTATTITGAVQELNDKIGSTALGTTAPTVTGAIKELHDEVDTNIPNLISNSISNALKWKIFGGGYVQGQTFVTVPAAAKEVYVIVYIKWTTSDKVMVDFQIPIDPYAFGSPTNFAQHVKFYGTNHDGYVSIEARTTDGTNFMRLYEARNGNTDVTAGAYCAYWYR